MCLAKPVVVTDTRKTLAYYICPFSVHYDSVMFYSTGPGLPCKYYTS
jgi:hypothetical protein